MALPGIKLRPVRARCVCYYAVSFQRRLFIVSTLPALHEWSRGSYLDGAEMSFVCNIRTSAISSSDRLLGVGRRHPRAKLTHRHPVTDAVGLSLPIVLLQASLNTLNVQSITGTSRQNALPILVMTGSAVWCLVNLCLTQSSKGQHSSLRRGLGALGLGQLRNEWDHGLRLE